MKPPQSIVFFTTSAGAGYGMLALMPWLAGTAHPITAGVAALALVSLGLLSSTVHLTNPKNAWRAVRCFRTSWLSREAVFALAVYPPALVVLAGHLGWLQAPVFTWLTAVLSLITLYCTGMIYQSLRTIPSWHTPFTALRFVFQGLASGALLWWMMIPATNSLAMTTIVLLLLALLSHLAGTLWEKRQTALSLTAALGIDQRPARLLNAGHSGSTFLTKEFGYETSRRRQQSLRLAELAFAYALPAVLLIDLPHAPHWIAPASGFFGVLVGRWLFFARAQHVVRLYHGQVVR